MRISHEHKKGFTLMEVLVVVAVLGILASIALPRVVAFMGQARLAADQATVSTLNGATSLYRIQSPEADPFEDESKSSEALQATLVEGEYLASVLVPKTEDATFAWLLDEEKWYLLFDDSFYVISLADGLDMDAAGYFTGRLRGSYSGFSKDIVIPWMLDGVVLTRIWQDVFEAKELVAVSFEAKSQIQQIHARAFYDNNLTQIDFPDSLERIDLWSFKNNNISALHLPSSLHTIESAAFDGNPLIKITIDSNVQVIGDAAFGEDRTEQFKQAYEVGGAGTYVYEGETWFKQEE